MVYRIYLEGERIYGCANCKTHLATIHSMMSRVSSLDGNRWTACLKTCNRHSTGNMVGRTYLRQCESIYNSPCDSFCLAGTLRFLFSASI